MKRGIGWFLFGISAAINVILIYFYSLTQTALEGYQNHPVIEYSDHGICLNEKLKSNGILIREYCDFDQDRIYDEISTFNLSGEILAKHFDLNNNLIPETSFHFDAQGKLVAKLLDRDENGWPEIRIEFRNNEKASRLYFDANQDAFFAENELIKRPYSLSSFMNE